VLLKGLTHWPYYCDHPSHRPQYDFDFYTPAGSIQAAREAISTLGYEPVAARGAATDHLPAMIRRTGFQWKGDYFDPDLPLLVEPHFRFWNPEREFFAVRSAEEFWARRITRQVGDLTLQTLDPVDCLSYATWHAVRHPLRGNLRLCHIYEIAHFLDRTHDNDAFWRQWAFVNGDEESLAESIAFRLASEWFGCRMNGVVAEQIQRLPNPVRQWFRLFAFSPVTAMERLNKDEIFLHLSLVSDRPERLRIAAKRIFPGNPPRVVFDAHTPTENTALKRRRMAHKINFLMRRAMRHVGALWPVLRSALRWWLA
ncbi:MAG: nucleotidyltransferase family protein, partial [Acidobacteriota bacterium]|nr:nucleotidyltransferase family protein [Acidobacteriota bacterium]